MFPDGRRLVVAIDVWPDAKSLAQSVARDEESSKSKIKAHVYEQLLFRHWDQGEDGKYSHVFVWDPSKPGEATDLTPGQTTDAPTHPFGGMEEIDISPDGRWIAVRSMKRPGFEADRERLVIFDATSHQSRVVTDGWDRSLGGTAWSRDGKTIFTDSDNVGNHALFAIDTAGSTVKMLANKGANNNVRVAADRLVFVRDGLTNPAELYTAKLDGSDMRALTH